MAPCVETEAQKQVGLFPARSYLLPSCSFARTLYGTTLLGHSRIFYLLGQQLKARASLLSV